MSKLKILLFLVFVLLSCNKNEDISPDINFKQEMRDFVMGISQTAKAVHTDFFIIPQNGIELVTDNGEENGPINSAYLEAIDGNGQEDLFYGYIKDDKATSPNDNAYLRTFLDISKASGNTILVTDYCSTPSKIDDSYQQNNAAGYVSFAADERELFSIPDYPTPVYGENDAVVTDLSQVENFLYLINPDRFNSKSDFINAVAATNYDLVLMDLFFHDGSVFSSVEIEQLRNKANGGKRLVICYMSIGEAEDYRYYWQPSWNSDKPSWLDKENPDWAGNYKVRYWEEDWQKIIFGSENAYLSKILEAGFDGVYLDIIDAFDYYE